MFCGIREEERTRFRNKKKGQRKQMEKKNNFIAPNCELVRMKGYLKTYKPREIFFAVRKLSLNEIAFYAKLSWRFLGPKTEVM